MNRLRYIPKRVYSLGVLTILSSLMAVAVDYSFSLLLQFYSFKIGFVSLEQLNDKVKIFLEYEKYFWPIFLLSIFLTWLVNMSQTLINMLFGELFVYEARKVLVKRLMEKYKTSMDLGTVSYHLSHSIINSSNFATTVARFATVFIQSAVLFFVCLSIMPTKFLFAVGCFALMLPPVYLLSKLSKRYGQQLIEKSRVLNQSLMSTVKNLLYVKILGLGEKEEEKLFSMLGDYYKSFKRMATFHSLSITMPSSLGLMVVFYLFWHFKESGDSPAVLMGLFYLLYRFAQYVAQVFATSNSMGIYYPSFKEFLKLNEEILADASRPAGQINTKTISQHDLMVSHLDFSYETKNSTHHVLRDISVNIKNGDVLVLQGPSGSGKSTLLMALIGILEAVKGKVEWGGIPIQNLEEENFRKVIAYVGPEAFLIKGTIRENLCYTLENQPSEEELERVCRLANIYDYINDIPERFSKKLTEQGEGLSMGQKQRLAFGRALLRKPKILVLDEITANLDKENEDIIVKNLLNLKGEMTILIATHSTAFDKISDQLIKLERLNK